MSSDPKKFFAEPQGAACLKLGVLRRYLPRFAAKTGMSAGRVSYIDGYAGKGKYDDGTPGSPAHAAAVASFLEGLGRDIELDGYLVEKDRDLFLALQRLILARRPTWIVRHGELEAYLPEITAWVAESPSFWFIDPFGLGLSFASVTQEILGRGSTTEVLMNLSCVAIKRRGSRLLERPADQAVEAGRQKTLTGLDAALGGQWWRDCWEAEDLDRSVATIVEGVVSRYSQRGFHTYAVPVADRWDQQPEYFLVLVTSYEPALWLFNEDVSLARSHCWKELGIEGRQAELNLFPDQQPIQPDDEAEWVSEIARNVRHLLTRRSRFRLLEEMEHVYGRTLGYARGTHITKALRTLGQGGGVEWEKTGNRPFDRLIMRSAPEAS